MIMRNRVAVAIVWMLSLVGVAVWAQGNPPAKEKLRITPVEQGAVVGPVISGADIGFQRVAGTHDRPGEVSGRFVVKIDGQWIRAVPIVEITR
jgi:hypothetical protein